MIGDKKVENSFKTKYIPSVCLQGKKKEQNKLNSLWYETSKSIQYRGLARTPMSVLGKVKHICIFRCTYFSLHILEFKTYPVHSNFPLTHQAT